MSDKPNEQFREGIEVSQRKLDQVHAQKLAVYILKGLISSAIQFRELQKQPAIPALNKIQEELGRQPYLSLQPLVANIRGIGHRGGLLRAERVISKDDLSTACFKVYLAQNNILWVVDGQHRREGMRIVSKAVPDKARGRRTRTQLICIQRRIHRHWQIALSDR